MALSEMTRAVGDGAVLFQHFVAEETGRSDILNCESRPKMSQEKLQNVEKELYGIIRNLERSEEGRKVQNTARKIGRVTSERARIFVRDTMKAARKAKDAVAKVFLFLLELVKSAIREGYDWMKRTVKWCFDIIKDVVDEIVEELGGWPGVVLTVSYTTYGTIIGGAVGGPVGAVVGAGLGFLTSMVIVDKIKKKG